MTARRTKPTTRKKTHSKRGARAEAKTGGAKGPDGERLYSRDELMSHLEWAMERAIPAGRRNLATALRSEWVLVPAKFRRYTDEERSDGLERHEGVAELDLTDRWAAVYSGSRLGFTGRSAALIHQLPDTIPGDSAYWARDLLEIGAGALLAATARLLEIGDLTRYPGSVLSLVGDLVADDIRRELLRRELERTDFQLSQVGDRLRLGAGAGNVLKIARALGLSEELEKARAAGKIKQGRRPRTSVDPPKGGKK